MKKISTLFFIIAILVAIPLGASAADYVYSASLDGELSLHISPDENSYKIMSIPACSKLKLIKRERTWGLVSFEKKSGWINLSFSRNSYKDAAMATGSSCMKTVEAVTNENKINLYTVPSELEKLGSKVKHTVPQGSVLTITRETSSGWGLVSMNGKYAWVEMKNTRPYETPETRTEQFSIYYVYTLSREGEGVSLWQSANGTNLCAVIPDCTKLTVREEKNNYGYVSYDGINGWINLEHTATSLESAQMNAGAAVNTEYMVTPSDGEKGVNLMSAPSEKQSDAAVVGTVGEGEIVYVLRATLSGWSLINYDGNLGWLPPDTLAVSEELKEDVITLLERPRSVYTKTTEKKELELYALPDGKTSGVKMPECTNLQIIARQGDYVYVFCDYASGWTLPSELSDTYEDAALTAASKKKSGYTTLCATTLVSVPSASPLCSEEISTIEEGLYFEVIKETVSGKKSWGLTRIDGKWGWIDLEYAYRTRLNKTLVIMLLSILAAVMIVAVAVLYLLKKKARKKTKKELDENETGEALSDESSGTLAESADVSGER